MQIKQQNILLDIGDTLVHITEPFEVYTRRAIRNVYQSLKPTSISEKDFVKEVYQYRVEVRKEAHASLREAPFGEFIHGALHKIGLSSAHVDALEYAYIQAEIEISEVFEDAQPFLNRAKVNGRRIYAATNNFSELHVRELLKKFDLLKYFDGLHVSGTVEIRKPHQSFLDGLCKNFNINADKSVMIGDKPHMDTLAAKRSGIKSILIDRYEKIDDLVLEETADYKIANLEKVDFC